MDPRPRTAADAPTGPHATPQPSNQASHAGSAAQLAALADMFPGRAPEQLISELLAVALKELAAAMPYVAGKRVISTDEHGDPVYEDVGPTPRFIELARLHRRALTAAPARRAPRPKTKKKKRRSGT